MLEAFIWFMAGMVTALILTVAAISIYVRVRGPFVIGPPE